MQIRHMKTQCMSSFKIKREQKRKAGGILFLTLFTLTGEVYPYYYRMTQFRTVVTLLDVMLNVHIYNPQPFCLVSLKVFLVERGALHIEFYNIS